MNDTKVQIGKYIFAEMSPGYFELDSNADGSTTANECALWIGPKGWCLALPGHGSVERPIVKQDLREVLDYIAQIL